MDFLSYLKKELDNILFLEIDKDIKFKDKAILKKGVYPIISKDMISFAREGKENIPISYFIKGMAYIIACDPTFKYNNDYINFMKNIPEAKSYLIMEIENKKNNDVKEALIFTRALCEVYPQKEHIMNKIYIMMNMYDKTGYKFLEDEIIYDLKELAKNYPNYSPPFFFLGEYYLNKDMSMSKMYFSKALNDDKYKLKALDYIEKIDLTEEYDKAVGKIKKGEGREVISILERYLQVFPNNLDCKYYLAMALRQATDYESALSILFELLNNGELPEIYNEIGLNYACINRFDKAIEFFKKSLKIKPDNPDIICNIGVCYYYLNDLQEAKKAFELCLRLNPNDDIAKLWIEKCK